MASVVGLSTYLKRQQSMPYNKTPHPICFVSAKIHIYVRGTSISSFTLIVINDMLFAALHALHEEIGIDQLNRTTRCMHSPSQAAPLPTTVYSTISYIKSRLTNSACNVFPNIAGLRSTITPAASNAEILESAPPFPPLTIAPMSKSVEKDVPRKDRDVPA
jgi:hypothetical protein